MDKIGLIDDSACFYNKVRVGVALRMVGLGGSLLRDNGC